MREAEPRKPEPMMPSVVVALRALAPGLPLPLRRTLMVGTAAYLAGALGFEVLGGLWVAENGKLNVGYLMLTTVEENLEMVGAMVVAWALAGHLRATAAD